MELTMTNISKYAFQTKGKSIDEIINGMLAHASTAGKCVACGNPNCKDHD